jgi:hypothetical protein
MKMKYIIVESYPLGTEAGIVFPAYLSHDSMAEKHITGTGEQKWYIGDQGCQKVVSAGECDVFIEMKRMSDDDGKIYEIPKISVNCSGESYIMNIKSRPEIDSKILTKMFNGEY